MKILPTRLRITGAVLTLCGLAVAFTVAGPLSSSAAAAGDPAQSAAAMTAKSSVPVLVNCLRHGDVRPSSYIFTCADANSALIGLHWASWTGTAAFASGTYAFNDCIPFCVEGHVHRFPVLVVLWHPEPWPGHHGVRYFSRMTLILTGNRTYTAGGHVHHLPVTVNLTLSTSGG
ncbi:MAG TPA: hypothetical protein VEF71_22000 [Streptosporangiaceae bacterium]|nr:hypothetical protein [Streptosporangiaceae bacterium]